MQRKKIAAVTKFLTPEQLQSLHRAAETLMQLEPLIRASDDRYLDLDPMTLAWILAVDAVYLLMFVKTQHDNEMGKLTGDILMLENQIPVFLLKGISGILKLSPGDASDYLLYTQMCSFCKQASPLKLNQGPMDIRDIMGQGHLLNVMYQLIVTNRGFKIQDSGFSPQLKIFETTLGDNLKHCVDIAVQGGVTGADIVQKHLMFMEKVPWERILALFKMDDLEEQNPLLVEEIDIPSVSQLSDVAGIKFTLATGGIRDVKFDEGAKKFYLPVITIKSDSEVILRNLLAYEAALVERDGLSTLELAEYVDLMCVIVDTPKDVGILKTEKIIESDLTDEEIACIFNGIRKSTGKKTEKAKSIETAIDKVNEQYENTSRVKVYKLMKRHVYASWKFLTLVSTVVVLLMLTLQALCEVYGCSRRWFK